MKNRDVKPTLFTIVSHSWDGSRMWEGYDTLFREFSYICYSIH